MNWTPSQNAISPEDIEAHTPSGIYSITKRKRRLILRRNGMVIGIHSDPPAIRRLAEADLALLQRKLSNVNAD